MKDVNKVILVGRLGADPIQRETKVGARVVSFSVATSRKVKSGTNSSDEPVYEDETQWHRIVAWGKHGETCAKYLKKGEMVYVEGSVRSRQYETKEGETRTSFEIHAESVSFLGSRKIPQEFPLLAEA